MLRREQRNAMGHIPTHHFPAGISKASATAEPTPLSSKEQRLIQSLRLLRKAVLI